MKTPNRRGGTGNRQGFTLLEIMIVVAVIGLLTAMAMPHYRRVREYSQANVCVNNLRILSGAKVQFSLEARLRTGDEIADDELDPYMRRPFELLEEPAGYEYLINVVGTPPACTLGDPHKL